MAFSLRTQILIGLLLAQLISACVPQATAAQTPSSPGPGLSEVTIPNSEVRQLKSTATGRSYDIYVRLPDEYAGARAKEYPVLYVLDGQWDFKLLDSIYGGLYYDGFIPEMIIVGITYSGDEPDYGALRAMDYTPVPDTFIPGSGDAPKFFAFLKEQLFPFIEANYRADASHRVLMGSSFGGTFTLYAMFSEPALFSGYVIGSPIVTYGRRIVFQQEADYASSHKDLPARLFLSVGELEPIVGPVQEFMQILRERNYSGLELETRVIEGERHAGNKPEAYNRGLRFVFQDE
ncbi:MAG TPA: alpha/beta hydrolase-fold protein [Anaerolineales bacterium]|nr:alpha/beta hydrolase-fold protein [Anaerolineales bacterium]